jgi:ketosteroid isomerase-like protein
MIGTIIARNNLKKGFQALGDHKLDEFMSAWRDEAVFVYPGDIHVSDTFEGREAVEKWFQNFLTQFPKIKFDILEICFENLLDFTGNNVAAVHWELEVRNIDGLEGQNSGVTVVTIEGGKALRVKDIIFGQGLKWKRNWGAA